MINIVIADHQAIFRAGVAKVLAVEDDLRIVGQPRTTEQMLNALERLRTHVLMVSTYFFPDFPAIRALTTRSSVAIMVVAENGEDSSPFLAMGVQGVAFRSINGATIVDAVRRLARGETFVHTPTSAATDISDDLVGTRVRDRLSEKELRIVAAVVRGYKNREIADQLYTSEQVVKNCLRSIFDKIGVSDRLELALFVLHHRMLAHATAAVQIENDQPGPKGIMLEKLTNRGIPPVKS
ncbi:MAG TPA: response regulator transcription factor [Candidatus Eisenbacteria bacterium]|nr:response regulator transcription factor [Candidatus Eisenbacteria bacterium]